MKYKLINKQTEETHLCDKVTIDGFDYYVSDEKINVGDYYLTFTNKTVMGDVRKCEDSSYNFTHCKKVIATNNSNIDIPQVVGEVENLAKENRFIWHETSRIQKYLESCFIEDYNKSQETHPFSEEDVEFFVKKVLEDAKKSVIWSEDYYKHLTKELLQLWREQRPKTLYYE